MGDLLDELPRARLHADVNVRYVLTVDFVDADHRPLVVLLDHGGLGKSQWTLALAGRVTRGELGDPAPVLIATSEDSIAATVKPRLEAVQADPNLYAFIKVQTERRP
jgi:hypothetical protein